MKKSIPILMITLCVLLLISATVPQLPIIIWDGVDKWTINSEGRGDVVQHAHPDNTWIHFHADGLNNGTFRYILIDISNIGTADNTYKHTSTDYLHIEWIQVQVDSDNNGDYTVALGFLENVDASNGDRYFFDHWSGTKTIGNQLGPLFESYAPNGWRLRRESVTTHMISLNDANWSSADTYGDSTNPAGSVNPGTGDLIVEIVVAAVGTINFQINIGYHSH